MGLLLQAFWARRWIASIARATIESLPQQTEERPEYFDNTGGIGTVRRPAFYKDKRSGKMLTFEGRAQELSPEDKLGVEAHITAVAFGTTKNARKLWKNKIESGELSSLVLEPYRLGMEGDVERIAERLALHQRFWKVPYHWVGLLNGDILHNNLITRYTHHGDSGNRRLIGVAAEADMPGLEKDRKKKHHDLSERFIETNRATLRLAVMKARHEGAPICRLYAHRQYSPKRVGDPGEGWWKEIGIPIAKELHLDRMTSFADGKGLEICREWDELGRVDYRGKRL